MSKSDAVPAKPKKVNMMNDWIEITKELPELGRTVHTKIDDAKGCRNEQDLKRGGSNGNLWFYPDGSMYVYYTPTHWKATKTNPAKQSEVLGTCDQHLGEHKKNVCWPNPNVPDTCINWKPVAHCEGCDRPNAIESHSLGTVEHPEVPVAAPEKREDGFTGKITKDDVDFIKSMCFQGPDMTERQERRVRRIIDELRLIAAPPEASK